MALSGRLLREASEALRDAFDLARFDQMLLFHRDVKRQNLSLGGDFQQIVFDVLLAAEREGWVPNLIEAAREANPTNARLMSVAEHWALSPVPGERSGALERIIREEAGFLDVSAWRERLGGLEGQVGRVEVTVPGGGTLYGTAFLVGPDLCLTNHHVLEPLISGTVPPSAALVRLDYRISGGTVLNPGTPFPLPDQDWLVDASPPSPVDSLVDPGTQLPAGDELDYALFRVSGSPGDEPVGGERAIPGAGPRGWLTLPASGGATPPDSSLFILQHPSAQPLKLAFDTVIGANANATRLRHRVNTEGGSSGSPCFDRDLALVALHHSGDPDFDAGHKPEYNEAVPIAAVHGLLTARGHAALLGPAGEQAGGGQAGDGRQAPGGPTGAGQARP